MNVDGTRNVLELARDCEHAAALQPLLHLLRRPATAWASSPRTSWTGARASATPTRRRKFQAEKLVQRAARQPARHRLPPLQVVGDSRTGEIDRFEGPYYLGILLVTSPAGGAAAAARQRRGAAQRGAGGLRGVRRVGALARSARRGPHLPPGGPQPHERPPRLRAHRGEGQPEAARASTSRPAPRTSCCACPCWRSWPGPSAPRISYVNHLAIYNCHNTLELLDGTGIRCPPLASYLDQLVAYVREQYRKRRENLEVEDPLDHAPAVPA